MRVLLVQEKNKFEQLKKKLLVQNMVFTQFARSLEHFFRTVGQINFVTK